MSLRSEALQQGLTSQEYDQIVESLGREPNAVELGIFAVLWSEHCSYKTSKIHLKQLPTRGQRVVQGPGENAGVIDIGEGQVLAFKIESHNHPSFIEPYQGSATGVGGILRDIFTMGARPVAILDSLHFGAPDHPRTSYLVHGVVSGIAGYGNCIGIPTVGGEVDFDASYNGNILVNVMAVGIAPKENLHRAIAKGVGNAVLYLGSKTGRDGIHGATMASEEFGAGNEERRPTVQVGDPFAEKLVMEACLEMMGEKLLVGIQDMGAAGIACSTFEMASRAGTGMRVNLDHVPLREKGMTPYDIFLSESQERMLLVTTRDQLPLVLAVAKKWDVECVEIGEVTDTGRIEADFHGERVVDLPVHPVTEGAPQYDRPWDVLTPSTKWLDGGSLAAEEFGNWVLELAGSPNLASKESIYRQYDHTVGSDTVIEPGSDAALLRIKGRKLGIAMTVDSNPHYCAADPYTGTQHVVAEAMRNLACVGARAVAVTNCLNFGNPEIPQVMAQLRDSIRGLSDACRALALPVTGGNVSLYNQTGYQSIRPTPAIGMVGLIDDASLALSAYVDAPGMRLALLGRADDTRIYDSEFARVILKRSDLGCPPLELGEEQALARALVQMTEERLLSAAHDCSSGGLVQALVEMLCGPSGRKIGLSFRVPTGHMPGAYLFGEYSGRAVVAFPPEKARRVEEVTRNHAIAFTPLGETGGDTLELAGSFQIPVADLRRRRDAFLRGL